MDGDRERSDELFCNTARPVNMTQKRLSKYIIDGSLPLKGEVTVSGAKNAAIKMVAASLLTGEEVILTNIPEIDDVAVMIEAASSLGIKTAWLDNHKLRLKADEIKTYTLDTALTCRARSTIMFMAPLLSRFGQFTLGEPGGCTIGKNRPINRHLEAFSQMGAQIEFKDGSYKGHVQGGLKGAEVIFEKNTVMGTESVLLSSVLASGITTILNAAQEPEVDDLILLLTKMGAIIERVTDRTIRVEGVATLHGASHEILPDRNEAATFAIAAAVTRGDLLIKNTKPSDMTALLAKLEKIGVAFEYGKNSLRVWALPDREFKSVSIETSPHPGFMTDWQQPICVLLTQAVGVSLVHDTIYINRFEFTKELNRMGSKIDVVRPCEAGIKTVVSDDDYDIGKEGEPFTVAKINGPTPLTGKRLTIPDLRAGATLVLAALCAKGKSEIFGVEYIDRGYELFDQKLTAIGARIIRTSV